MKRIGTLRIVPYEKAQWYLDRGWEPFHLGRYHSNFSMGFFKRWPT